MNAAISKVSISTTTIDALVAEHNLMPGFMKVDTEGWEHEVFQGSTQVLSSFRPIVLTELNGNMLSANGSSMEFVMDLLRCHDYVVLNPITGQPEFHDDQNEFLACPRELVSQLPS